MDMQRRDPSAPLEWEEFEWFGIDSGTLGFADARAKVCIDNGDTVEWSSGEPTDLGLIGGFSCAMWPVGDDVDAQIEVARGVAGVAIAVRVEIVSDVAAQVGAWVDMAELELATGRVAVCDPFCAKDDHYWHPVDVRPGVYRYQLFVSETDGALGFRIVRDH